MLLVHGADMSSTANGWLCCSCTTLVRRRFIPCLERHLTHGPPEMRSSIVTLMGNMIRHCDEGIEDSSEASKSAMRTTNWSLLHQILIKSEDENARTRVRVIQVRCMLWSRPMLLMQFSSVGQAPAADASDCKFPAVFGHAC